MSNKIYIKYVTMTENQEAKKDTDKVKNTSGDNKDSKKVLKYKAGETVGIFPLLDDLTVDITSEHSTFAGMVPMLENAVNFMVTASSIGGGISEGTLDLQNMFHVPRWTKTNPIRISTKIPFFAEEDPEKDVYIKMMNIINLSIPSRNGKTGRYILPGVSLSSMYLSKRSATNNKKDTFKSGKFISLKIPGIIYIPIAMVTKAIPTYSKEVTESGFPLWGTIDLEVIGLTPATSDDLNNTLEATRNNKARKIKEAGNAGSGNTGVGTISGE